MIHQTCLVGVWHAQFNSKNPNSQQKCCSDRIIVPVKHHLSILGRSSKICSVRKEDLSILLILLNTRLYKTCSVGMFG